MKTDMDRVQELFGGEIYEPEQTQRICILKDIMVHVGVYGTEEYFRCAPDGIERGESLRDAEYHGKPFRIYECRNCGEEFSGSKDDDFLAVKKHIGHKNPFERPFQFNFRGSEL